MSPLSEALSVDDLGAIFVVLLLVDPHGLESGERCEDRTTKPHRVFTLGWRQNLDFIGGWCQLMEFLPHTLTHAFKEGRTTRQDNVLEEIFTNVVVALRD